MFPTGSIEQMSVTLDPQVRWTGDDVQQLTRILVLGVRYVVATPVPLHCAGTDRMTACPIVAIIVLEAIVMFDRITADPRQMGGVPCIRGLRIPVSTIVGMIADGMSASEILDAYPDLESEDIVQALRYAAYLTKDREIELAHS